MVQAAIGRLSESSAKVLFTARRSVSRFGGTNIESEHLLLGICDVAPSALEPFIATDWSVNRIQDRLVTFVSAAQKVPEDAEVSAGVSTNRILVRAAMEADIFASDRIEIGHVLLALVTDDGNAGRLLREAGVTHEKVLTSMRSK
jgi:ATP-dependent Clp protease ATP-binding subunit ClpA